MMITRTLSRTEFRLIQYDRIDSRKRRITQICDVGVLGVFGNFDDARVAARDHKRDYPLAGRVIIRE